MLGSLLNTALGYDCNPQRTNLVQEVKKMHVVSSPTPLGFPRQLIWPEVSYFQWRNCKLALGSLLSKHSSPPCETCSGQKQPGSVAQASSKQRHRCINVTFPQPRTGIHLGSTMDDTHWINMPFQSPKPSMGHWVYVPIYWLQEELFSVRRCQTLSPCPKSQCQLPPTQIYHCPRLKPPVTVAVPLG